MTAAALDELRRRLGEIDDLQRARNVLVWDMEVWMPRTGGDARARQLATLGAVLHERQVDDRIGELLDELEAYRGTLPADSDDACLLRLARRQWERARRVPEALAADLARAYAEAYQAWVPAREEGEFARFRPYLERVLELTREWIECFEPYDDPYDVLLDRWDEGLRTEDVRSVFAALQPEVTALVAEHADAEPYDDPYDVLLDRWDEGLRTEDVRSVFAAVQPEVTALVAEHADAEADDVLEGPFPVDAQDALSRELISRFGASWDEFRLDLTVHPFEIAFGLHDVRLTTRYAENDLNALFTAMHECGHGLYEWGSSASLERTPLQGCHSAMLHESQSRLWENVVGRSLPFWRWFYPRVREAFPDRLAGVSLEQFHRAVNRPRRTFIRVDADEVSYGLHVILRFELEQRLFAGELAVADLPDAWNARFEELLGLPVDDDRDGVLQDGHWASGYFGYFPTYLLGTVLSVQIAEKAREAIPDLDEQLERGDFGELHAWLRDTMYALGSKFTPAETVERVVGGPLEPQPYLRYLREKLGALSAA